jgi:hypothetical protein
MPIQHTFCSIQIVADPVRCILPLITFISPYGGTSRNNCCISRWPYPRPHAHNKARIMRGEYGERSSVILKLVCDLRRESGVNDDGYIVFRMLGG